MAKKFSNIIFYLTLIIIAICVACIWMFSGFRHEYGKFNMILVAFLAVTLLQILIFTPIKFTILSLDAAFWPAHQAPETPNENANVDTFMDNLRLRLRTLRSELMITERHRNERVNLKYRLITEELWLTGKLFLVYFFMALAFFDELLYFNTETTEILFQYNRGDAFGLFHVADVPDIYFFVVTSLVLAFTDGKNTSGGAPWIHAEGTRLLGVVRLRQLRTESNRLGLSLPVFTERDFGESWTLPYERVPYTDKYWPIYTPWLPSVSVARDNLLMGINHVGHMFNYPESKGYKVLLSDTRYKSLQIIDYLMNKNWLDANTTALFMDFSLYNADANTFTVCTLWVEKFPYQYPDGHMKVESHTFVEQLREFTKFGMLMVFVFVVTWLQFTKAFFVKVWYDPRQLKTLWVLVDAMIVALSVIVGMIMAVRDNMVQKMIKRVEIAVVVDFLDFREPAQLSYLEDVVTGLTVALVTMRLWKVMQFSATFQLFTKTIAMAWDALLCTFVITVIFIIAIGIATVTINGNYTSNFRDFPKGIVTVTCFAFGYTNLVYPPDIFYGGEWLGIVLYTIMGFVVKYMLINLIVSMMRDQMASVKADRDKKVRQRITFWQFLRVEYAFFINYIVKVFHCQRGYQRKNRTVAQNIQRELNSIELKRRKTKISSIYSETIYVMPINKDLEQMKYRERIERTFTLAAILHTQMELMERLMFGDEEGNLPSLDQDDEQITDTDED
ncbi:polycystin-2 [Drosophila simulans]|uniref:Uncharacterized protein, isoform A n=1 Tax=Drosophila simulans TaxID=7240 RepID=A0A0J9RY75_DROSI|nr:polycystin-2 [Drosophila simulans]KMZ00543.1 uncharacterized protein Dsimw501_GD12280, isoform A [Drosophila simulans]KMZ00544.1 uncharacterized protein Dsimw501_GD12280, isoform B [Drosophila simulans]